MNCRQDFWAERRGDPSVCRLLSGAPDACFRGTPGAGAAEADIGGLDVSARTARLKEAEGVPSVTELVAKGAAVVVPKVMDSVFYKNLD